LRNIEILLEHLVEYEQRPLANALFEGRKRIIALRLLQMQWVDGILAENGADEVRIFKERYREIKAVLLDMIMPKKSGKDAYLEMKKIDPNLKVLLTSGFKHDERVEAVLHLGVQGFVQKPFSLDALAKAIFAVLNA
jgi:DNA-binding NarL/FixJ family response regulator